MKVLHVCFSGGWGGLEKYSVELAQGLAEKGLTVHYACAPETTIERELQRISLPHTPLVHRAKYVDVRLMLALHRLIKDGGYQIVHAHMSQDLGIVVPALWGLPSVKLFFSLHMIVPGAKKDIYHAWQYRRVRKIFALGKAGEDSAVENLPIRREQAMELPYGLPVHDYQPGRNADKRRELGFKDDDILLGIISRLEPLKGQREAIQAMPEVLKEKPTAHLLLVGDETEHLKGTVKPELEAEAQRLGVAESVHFLGFRRDVPELLRSLDVFLLPSHFESYSISVIEAKLCGVPVVGSDTGGVRQNLGYGEYGVLVTPKDPAALAEGILKVLGDPSDARQRAEAARANALERYDRHRILNIVMQEYDR